MINTWAEKATPLRVPSAWVCSVWLKLSTSPEAQCRPHTSLVFDVCVHFVTPALWKPVQEGQQFKTSLSYWAKRDLVWEAGVWRGMKILVVFSTLEGAVYCRWKKLSGWWMEESDESIFESCNLHEILRHLQSKQLCDSGGINILRIHRSHLCDRFFGRSSLSFPDNPLSDVAHGRTGPSLPYLYPCMLCCCSVAIACCTGQH